MDRRNFLKMGAGAGIASFLWDGCGSSSACEPLNVLWIVADDLGYGDLGCYGCRDIPTPRLDRLASEGILFERAYASPVCSPTRASLLTGRYPQDFRMEDALVGQHGSLSPDPVTAAELFRDAGYKTALVGKWHLGKNRESHPLSQGFDEFYGFLGGAIHYEKHTYLPPGQRDESLASVDFFDGWNVSHDVGHSTDLFVKRAETFLKNRGEDKNPFFLQVAFNAPHYARGTSEKNPRKPEEILQAPSKWVEMFAKNPAAPSLRELYRAVVAQMDDGIGRLLETLKASGMDKNTIVLFMSDHGATLPHGGSNGLLRGEKHTLWEGGIRTPCMVRLPLKSFFDKRRGIRFRQPCSVRDIFPTTSALAGLSMNAAEVAGLEMGSNRADEWLSGRENTVASEVRSECFKYGEKRAVVRGRWKMIQDKIGGLIELYDVESDPSETKNIASSFPEISVQLEREWNKWYRPYAKRESAIASEEHDSNKKRLDAATLALQQCPTNSTASAEKQKAWEQASSGMKWAEREKMHAEHWARTVGE